MFDDDRHLQGLMGKIRVSLAKFDLLAHREETPMALGVLLLLHVAC